MAVVNYSEVLNQVETKKKQALEAEIGAEQKKFWDLRHKSKKQHVLDAAYAIGRVVGFLGALTFGFIYTTCLFTSGLFPLWGALLVLGITGIPSIIVEVLVLAVMKNNVGDAFKAFAEFIWNKTEANKNAAQKTKLSTRGIFIVTPSVVLNAAGMALFSGVSIYLFLISPWIALAGPAAIAIPIIFATFLFCSSCSFNFYVNRSDLLKGKEEGKKSFLQHIREFFSKLKNASLNSILSWTFGIVAGLGAAGIALLAIPTLPFSLPVLATIAAIVAVPLIVTQVLAAKNGFYEWLTGKDVLSTKANAFADHARLKKKINKGEKFRKFETFKHNMLQNHAVSWVWGKITSKWSLLILKGISNGLFTALALATLSVFGFTVPLGLGIALGVAFGLFDIFNTAFQNRTVVYNQKDDIEALQEELTTATLSIIEDEDDEKKNVGMYFSKKSFSEPSFRKDVNDWYSNADKQRDTNFPKIALGA